MTKIEDLKKAINVVEKNKSILGVKTTKIVLESLTNQLEILSSSKEITVQRKLVSIFFLDIVQSTKLSAKLDPEESLSLFDSILQKFSIIIQEHHGGKVTRFMGDGLLAIFGLSIAKENDAERAVLAGLDIINELPELSEQLKTRLATDSIKVRIGINTGLIASGGLTEAENTFAGNAVNLGARLESFAPANGILISHYTYQHIQGLFECEKLDKITVKGFIEPVQVYLIKNKVQSAYKMVARGIEGVETSLIGREKELNLLMQSFMKINSELFSDSVVVIGDGGLGKTRLLIQFEQWISSQSIPVNVFKSRSMLEMEYFPYGLIRSLFSEKFQILDTDTIQLVKEKFVTGFCDFIDDQKDVEKIAIIIGQLLGYDFSQNTIIKNLIDNPKLLRENAIFQLLNYFKKLALKQSLVFILDDLQWADSSSLDFLIKLKTELKNFKIMFLLSTRPALITKKPKFVNAIKNRIDLEPLNKENLILLVKELLYKVDYVPNEIIDLLTSKSDGNPYYLEELIKILIDDGVIIQGSDYWAITREKLKEIRIPTTLTGIIQSRLDKLSEKEKEIIQNAAVVGNIFWSELVYELINDDSIQIEKKIDTELTKLCDKGLIKRINQSLIDISAFEFSQNIIREVAYESVSKVQRKKCHSKIADWLSENVQNKTMDFIAIIVHHLEQSERLEETYAYLYHAGITSLTNYAIAEAESFFERALTISGTDEEKKYRILIEEEKIYQIKGDRNKQKKVIDSLMEIAKNLEDNRKICEVLIRKSWLDFWLGDFNQMFNSAARAEELALLLKSNKLLFLSNRAQSWSLLKKGLVKKAEEKANSLLPIVKPSSNINEEGLVLNLLAIIKITQGDYYNAKIYLEEFLSINRLIGDQQGINTALNNLGVALISIGKYLQAQDSFEQLLARAQQIGDNIIIINSLINLSWVMTCLENWVEAINYANRGIKLARDSENIEAIAEGLVWLGNAQLGLKNYERAEESYGESIEYRINLDQDSIVMGAYAGLLNCSVELGNKAKIEKYSALILEFLEQGGNIIEVWEPFKVYVSCIKGLREINDNKWEDVLQNAYNLLNDNSLRIQDEKERQNYLENVKTHKEIINLLNEMKK